MKALLIKTDERKVEEVEFDGTLEDVYRLLDVDIIERVEIAGHDIWLDEEGSFTQRTIDKGMFGVHTLYGYVQIYGRGLITGKAEDADGEETWGDVTLTVEQATTIVDFLS